MRLSFFASPLAFSLCLSFFPVVFFFFLRKVALHYCPCSPYFSYFSYFSSFLLLTNNICLFSRLFLSDNWSEKAKRRRTTGTGRCRYLKTVARRAKNGFREGSQAPARKVASK